jgi:predicted methyltransferase
MMLAFAVCQMALYFAAPAWADENTTDTHAALPDSNGISARDVPTEPAESGPVKANDRAASIRALVSHLDLGEGSVIADIGAGGGRDTWVFAKIVGETGTVFAEEIAENKVESLRTEAEKRDLKQVRPVLGQSDDPCLPLNSADLVYMNHVYHHFAKPREMLRGIWRSLKPGAYMVVVDRHRGTLRDWVERKLREQKHYWIAETTVVREAREEGFAFVECAEQYWHTEDDFVLVFQRPRGLQEPGRDPDPMPPIPIEKCTHLLLPVAHEYRKPVFVALGEAGELIAPILENSSGKGLEIVLEEWATQKDERPPLPPGVSIPSVLTQQGDPNLPDEPIDAVFFLDSYHLLFHGRTLLTKLHEKLSPTGCIYVLDRKAEKPLSRREASHHRRIQPRTVKEEMAEAGFFLWFRGPPPTRDSFLLVFGKARSKKVAPEDDPFVGGPEIPGSPDQWLARNCWRLRGLKMADDRFVTLRPTNRKRPVQKLLSSSRGTEILKIPNEELVLYFDKKNDKYLLTDYQPLDRP